ncbi:putative pentatricopeptide repeat-containing protein At5g59200, chloroplastic [Magnolia sinica]|uniref:putative pentatricopeptide repeat-containing protein At5g59200, chloroplastic n=1 Tax=Magnolia sinica TaxID=86752 RepID=UPI00265B274A|nr:putative pentatricopeptide repeat-containing protein At5g59200, chloroplastic [Magnolia sinica]
MGSPTITVGSSPFPLISNSNSKTKHSHPQNQTISLLQSCKSISQFPQIHAKVIKDGHQQDTHLLYNILRFCSNHKSMDYASKIFEKIKNPNVYLYTALIDGQITSRSYLDAIRIYSQMVGESVEPDSYVISSVLRACGFRSDLNAGREIHGRVLKLQLRSNRSVRMKLIEFYGKCGEFADARQVFSEFPERDVVASTVLISCYADHGLTKDARVVFEEVPEKDTVCWTAMINGYARNGRMNEALALFRKMQGENVRPNEVTIVCVLSACSQMGALELGRWIDSYVGKYNIRLNVFVGSTLIDMYSKCGSLDDARRVFTEMPKRDVVAYNSMIAGLALHGKSGEAVEMFRQMAQQGLRPTQVTFVAVLNACSHGGLVDLGFEIFHSMTNKYGIEPRIEHYGCMVDLLGRVGYLEEAYDFIGKMRIEPDHVIWGALLAACKIHGNLTLAERVAEILVNERAADSGTYVLLANTYASLGKWDAAAHVRSKMKGRGIQKEPGCSSIEVNNEIHEFMLGDLRHPQREGIYKKLEELNGILKSEGYSPATDIVLQDIDEGEKEWALAIHSERLAICYGLISTKQQTTIRVVKNLRVCGDCHTMIKLIAKITRRKIIVRDRNRFHHFEDGRCSCGDYW